MNIDIKEIIQLMREEAPFLFKKNESYRIVKKTLEQQQKEIESRDRVIERFINLREEILTFAHIDKPDCTLTDLIAVAKELLNVDG